MIDYIIYYAKSDPVGFLLTLVIIYVGLRLSSKAIPILIGAINISRNRKN